MFVSGKAISEMPDKKMYCFIYTLLNISGIVYIMRNLIGPIVTGEDYFPDERTHQRVRTEIEKGVNVNMPGPRRTGKSSFVKNFCEDMKVAGWHTVYCDVQGADTPLQFCQKVVDSVQAEGFIPAGKARFRQLLDAARKIKKVKLLDFIEIEGEGQSGSLTDLLEELVKECNSLDKKVILAIDEMTLFLVYLLRENNGDLREADKFLATLRRLRSQYTNVKWIFLGSIGLFQFARKHGLSSHLNDLSPQMIPPLDRDRAKDMLQKLAKGAGSTVIESEDYFLDRLGAPTYFDVQLLFSEVMNQNNGTPITKKAIDQAFLQLVEGNGKSRFATWHERLDDYLEPEEVGDTLAILAHLSLVDSATMDELLNPLMARIPNRNLKETESILKSLVDGLAEDGYITGISDDSSNRRYAFRSLLLKECWKRWWS